MTPPLVMLPGSLCDERLFTPQIEAIDAQIHVGDLGLDDTIEGMASRVLAHAPDTFAVAGLSLGGIVAAEIVRQAAHRVLGVALLDTNLAAANGAQRRMRRRWAQDVRTGIFAQVVAENLVEPLTARPDELGPLVFAMADAVGPAAFLRQNTALIGRNDLRPVLDPLDVPVLIACGELDLVCPPELHVELARHVPDAHLEIVPGAGHLSTIDRPDELTRLLDGWLMTCTTTKNTQKQEGNTHEHHPA